MVRRGDIRVRREDIRVRRGDISVSWNSSINSSQNLS